MKKITIILIMLVGVALTACDEHEGALSTSHNVKGLEKAYKIVVIDGCEYISYDAKRGYSGYAYFAHKGNCSNKIHCHNL